MVLECIFLNKKVVDSLKSTSGHFYFSDFLYDGNIFSVFISKKEVYEKLENVSLGTAVTLLYSPSVYNNKLQFNLTDIEVI